VHVLSYNAASEGYTATALLK